MTLYHVATMNYYDVIYEDNIVITFNSTIFISLEDHDAFVITEDLTMYNISHYMNNFLSNSS